MSDAIIEPQGPWGQAARGQGRGTERARLLFQGLRSPVVSSIARRRRDGLTLVQKLPLLALGSEVRDESGRAARIARVAVALHDEVPQLVIELDYERDDDEAACADGVARFGTPSSPPPSSPPPAVEASSLPADRPAWSPSKPARRDPTLGYAERPSRPPSSPPPPMRGDETNRELTLAFSTEPIEKSAPRGVFARLWSMLDALWSFWSAIIAPNRA